MSILDRIVADTRDLVARRKARLSAADLRDREGFSRTTRPLAPALRQDRLAFLAEIKKASPSKGVIREDFQVDLLAQRYAEGGAAALSVLTEPLHFQGSLEYLEAVRRTVELPLLRKDFIVDPYQLYEARAYGADAVLLIAAVLEPAQLYDLHQTAGEFGLACLVEVYQADELEKIDFDQVQILGVNNRDLRTFEVDVDHSLRVFARAPEGVVRVSESGLRTPADLAHLRRHGIDAVLIGETFMRAPDPGQKLEEMRRALEEALEGA